MTTSVNDKHIATAHDTINAIITEIKKNVIGQDRLIRNLLIALISQWHIILEWVPWLAKTLSIQSLAQTVHLHFSRIQFTPDLLPSDLIGSQIYNQQTHTFSVKQWPIFANFVLADEINRAPAKVQSALLEAMAEKQVTIGDETFSLDEPFVVLATQNPLEQEWTYSLPEAQMDRFLLKTIIDYPTEDEEVEIMQRAAAWQCETIKKVATKKKLHDLIETAQQVHVADSIYTYVKDLIMATREPSSYGLDALEELISFGWSPRASIALIQTAKVHALMEGRWFVLPDDVKAMAADVLRHRLILTYDALAQWVTVDEIINTILSHVPIVQ